MTIRVAIVGSCVSRLAFRSDFVPECKSFFNVVNYAFHASIISILARPINYNISEFKGKDDTYAKEHLKSELEKDVLNNLIASSPDILIIDLYPDVHFGVTYTNNSIITNKCWRYKRIDAFNKVEIKKNLDPLSNFNEYFDVWKENISHFFEFMRKFLPYTKIYLTSARFDQFYNSGNDIKVLDCQYDIKIRNEVWERLDNYLIDNFKEVSRLDLRRKYLLSESHIHGLDPVHYEKSYYNDFIIAVFNQYFKKNITHIQDLKELQLDKLKIERRQFIEQVPLRWNLLGLENVWQESCNFNISDDGMVEIAVSGLEKAVYNQLHSLPIEINSTDSSPLCFRLKFEIWVENIDEFSKDDSIFLIRMHSDKFQLWHKGSIFSYALKAKDYGIESKRWNVVEILFYPKGRFVRVGPYLPKNGSAKWKNIELERFYY